MLVRGAAAPPQPSTDMAVPGPAPAGGDRAPLRPPTFEVCTCFQNLTTFLPRRIRFWSVTLRATKLRSPPWTLAPMANNLVSFLFFSFFVMRRSIGRIAAHPHWVPGSITTEDLYGWNRVESGRDAVGAGVDPSPGSPWCARPRAPQSRPQAWARAWPTTGANSPPGGGSGKGRGLSSALGGWGVVGCRVCEKL